MLTRARDLWLHLAGAPVSFRDDRLDVVAAPGSRLCPPGWVGIVALGGSAIATAPDPDPVRRALAGLPVAALTDPAAVGERLPVADVLGPATLAYGSRSPQVAEDVETVPRGHADLVELTASVPPDEAAEAALDDLTAPAFVLRDGAGRITAAAGYQLWPLGTAHLSVLTAPAHRGRGLARTVAAAATRDALARDLLPQWRARPAASRRVARALGFQELGAQLSVRIGSHA